MFCSTVIPTIGRATLSRAVNSVLNQTITGDAFEVIVVNDSGVPLPHMPWQDDAHVRIINTNRRERCVARNAGAAIARGRYLNFLDDDDWLLPGAFSAIQEMAQSDNSAWMYGQTQLVNREGQPIITLRHNINGNAFAQSMAGEWIPLPASFIDNSAFFAVGGFTQLIPGAEDIDLLRKITLRYDISEVKTAVACLGMGVEQSATDYARAPAYGRWAREKILETPHVFSRFRQSSSNAFWFGRVVRVYLTSSVWNIRQKKLLTAISRASRGVLAGVVAGYRLFSHRFWLALIRPYESDTFLRGFEDAGLPVQRRHAGNHKFIETNIVDGDNLL